MKFSEIRKPTYFRERKRGDETFYRRFFLRYSDVPATAVAAITVAVVTRTGSGLGAGADISAGGAEVSVVVEESSSG